MVIRPPSILVSEEISSVNMGDAISLLYITSGEAALPTLYVNGCWN